MRGERFLVALLLAVLAGCGPGHGLNLGRVSGMVTYRGEPVRYGFVTFQPDETKGTDGPPAMSTISKDGFYALTTSDAADGALVGFHKIAIIALDPDPISGADAPEPAEAPNEFMASKAARPRPKARTKAKAAGPTFTSRNGKVYRILGPEKLGNPDTSGVSVEVRGRSNTVNLQVKDDGTVDVSS
jgi:hypothetical protein